MLNHCTGCKGVALNSSYGSSTNLKFLWRPSLSPFQGMACLRRCTR